MAWLGLFLPTIVPSSYAPSGNWTHGRVAPTFEGRSTDWAIRPRQVKQLLKSCQTVFEFQHRSGHRLVDKLGHGHGVADGGKRRRFAVGVGRHRPLGRFDVDLQQRRVVFRQIRKDAFLRRSRSRHRSNGGQGQEEDRQHRHFVRTWASQLERLDRVTTATRFFLSTFWHQAAFLRIQDWEDLWQLCHKDKIVLSCRGRASGQHDLKKTPAFNFVVPSKKVKFLLVC